MAGVAGAPKEEDKTPDLGLIRVLVYDLDTKTPDARKRYREMEELLENLCGGTGCSKREQLSVWEVPRDAIKLDDLKQKIQAILRGNDKVSIYFVNDKNHLSRLDLP